MVEVKFTQDIRKYEAKIIGPFNKRQLISILCLLPFECLLFILGWKRIPPEFFLVLIVIIALPFLAFGYIKLYQLPLEQFLKIYVQSFILSPLKRMVDNENQFVTKVKKILNEKEKEYYKSLSKQEKKKYDKAKRMESKTNTRNIKKYEPHVPKSLEGDFELYR